MRRHDKRVAKIRRNPKNVRFDDLVRVVEAEGWVQINVRGSHHTFAVADHPEADEMVIVKPHGNHKFCHPADVREVLAMVDSRQAGDDDDGQ